MNKEENKKGMVKLTKRDIENRKFSIKKCDDLWDTIEQIAFELSEIRQFIGLRDWEFRELIEGKRLKKIKNNPRDKKNISYDNCISTGTENPKVEKYY